MAISIVTFANLGTKTNLKTADIEPVIRAFEQKKALDTVVCQLHRDFYFSNTMAAVPKAVHYPLRLLEMLGLLSRPATEAVFDYFAARRLPASAVVLLHGGDSLPRTAKRAKSQGSLVIDITVMPNLAWVAHLERDEVQTLSLDELYATYTNMSRRSTPVAVFDYFVAISELVKESYVRAGVSAERIFVAAPDISISRFTPSANTDDVFRALYVAYTTPLKGLGYLLEAWDQLDLPNAELVLVGGYGDMSPELVRRYDEQITKNPTIRFVGPQAKPEEYYQDASVLVFPSLTEGFGRVTLEAMASGLPVITTENARGIVEDGKTGFVVPIRDSKALAEKIQYMYEHRDEAAAMGKAARAAVEHKKPFGEAVYEIYQEILRREHKA